MNNMNKMKIRLNATADVQEFVRAAEKCDFDIDIQYDSTIVDAKSILGIFSLGLAKIFTVNCHGENAEFVDAIQKFAVAKNCLSPSFLYPPFFNQLPSPNGSWFFSRVMSQSPSLLETLANTAKPGESSKGSWHRKINYYKVLRK